MQSIMGSPESHCKTRDETSVETKNVRLPQRLCREDHHTQDCTSKNYQQVHSHVDNPLHIKAFLTHFPEFLYLRNITVESDFEFSLMIKHV